MYRLRTYFSGVALRKDFVIKPKYSVLVKPFPAFCNLLTAVILEDKQLVIGCFLTMECVSKIQLSLKKRNKTTGTAEPGAGGALAPPEFPKKIKTY